MQKSHQTDQVQIDQTDQIDQKSDQTNQMQKIDQTRSSTLDNHVCIHAKPVNSNFSFSV